MDEPAGRFGHGDERAKYNQRCVHGLPPGSLDEEGSDERIESGRFSSTGGPPAGVSPAGSGAVGTPTAPPDAVGMTPTVALLSLLLSFPATLGTAPLPSPALTRPVPPVTGLAPASATAVWPLDPQPAVVADFDPPQSRYGAGHRGVDLAGEPGQRVRTAAAGRVTYAGALAGRGVVVVAHGSTRTTYQPVEAAVEVGALVDAGDLIGTLERSGSHCAPEVCLHWGLIEGETYLDPLSLLGAGPVRLLPLFGAHPAAPAP